MPDWMAYFVDAAILMPVTVSFGSVLARTVLAPDTTVTQGGLALGALFCVQWAIGYARSRSARVEGLADNTPLFLMHDGEVIEANLSRACVTMADLRAKLRGANVMHLSEVCAVVLETTGDVSVLHGDDLETDLLEGVTC